MMQKNYYSNPRRDVQKYLPMNMNNILDIGCATGAFLLEIKTSRPNVETWGVEINEQVAKFAENKLNFLYKNDLLLIHTELPKNYFDCISFNDVLEHTCSPQEYLKIAKCLLKNDGFVLVSLPNIRYFSAIYELICCKDFPCHEHGIFDQTHLKFYTLKSAIRLFKSCGFFVESYHPTNLIARRYRYPLSILNALLLGAFNDSFCKQYIFKLKIA